MRLEGTVRFPPGEPVEAAALHIAVRDITEMDGPAPTVASVDLAHVTVPENGLDVPFAIDVDLGDPRRTYAVRAHADRSGSGVVEPGDLVTTTAHLVGPSTAERPVLELQPVGR
jgi:putative lipoprotein